VIAKGKKADIIYFSSSNLFSCVGLRKKQYCILNKQYLKEEYFELKEKIIKHMNEMPYIDKNGNVYKYGEFFPSELSPFSYNKSIAQEYFQKTKEKIIENGFLYRKPKERNYQTTIDLKSLANHIKKCFR